MHEQHVSVYVTAPDAEVARRIARHVVQERLAACANMMPIHSIYRWEGAVQEEPEVALFLKTRRALVPALEQAVRTLHPAQVPCIVAFDLVGGHAPYLAWVDAETSSPRPTK